MVFVIGGTYEDYLGGLIRGELEGGRAMVGERGATVGEGRATEHSDIPRRQTVGVCLLPGRMTVLLNGGSRHSSRQRNTGRPSFVGNHWMV